MRPTRKEKSAEIKKLKDEDRELFTMISRLLFLYDPMGLNFDSNRDEYEPETGSILPRLRDCHSAEDVQRVVHEEFKHWFGAGAAGPLKNYLPAATKIWELWRVTAGH